MKRTEDANIYAVLASQEKPSKEKKRSGENSTASLVRFTSKETVESGRGFHLLDRTQVLMNLFQHATKSHAFYKRIKDEPVNERLMFEMKYYVVGFLSRLHDLKLCKPIPMWKEYFKMIKKDESLADRNLNDLKDIISESRQEISHCCLSLYSDKQQVMDQFSFYQYMLERLIKIEHFFQTNAVSLRQSLLNTPLLPIDFDRYDVDKVENLFAVKKHMLLSYLLKQFEWVNEFSKTIQGGEPDKALLTAVAEIGEFFNQTHAQKKAETGDLIINGHSVNSFHIDDFVSVRNAVYHPDNTTLNMQALENAVNFTQFIFHVDKPAPCKALKKK